MHWDEKFHVFSHFLEKKNHQKKQILVMAIFIFHETIFTLAATLTLSMSGSP
jgi:hypothetical protein